MPSRRRASANFLSSLTCCCTRSLKLFVLAIFRLRSAPPALAPFVVLPKGVSRIDVALLTLLCAARQQDYQRLTISPEIDPVARTEVDPVFEHAFANRSDVGEVALLQP